MLLANLVEEDNVLCGAHAASYADAKALLVRHCGARLGVDADAILRALLEREALAPTVLAPGIAIPHARIRELPDFFLLVGLFPAGVPYEGPNGPLHVVSLFLIPEGASHLYLRCASAMLRYLQEAGPPERVAALDAPAALVAELHERNVAVSKVVAASDVMNPHPPSLRADATLRDAADLMARTRSRTLPIVDAEGRLLGVVTTEALLRVGIPDYLLQMDSVGFLEEFEPFAELLKSEQSLTVDTIAAPPDLVASPDTPLIQVASRMVRRGLDCLPVVHADGRLAGTLCILDLVTKVVRA